LTPPCINDVDLISKNMAVFKTQEEWFEQADYDIETAEALFNAGRYIYTVFMCHLSIEKALKGVYAKKFKKDPPKIHNLNYFIEETGLELPEKFQVFIDKLNGLSIPTRYPNEIKKLIREYKKDLTEKVLDETKELLLCLKQKMI